MFPRIPPNLPRTHHPIANRHSRSSQINISHRGAIPARIGCYAGRRHVEVSGNPEEEEVCGEFLGFGGGIGGFGEIEEREAGGGVGGADEAEG